MERKQRELVAAKRVRHMQENYNKGSKDLPKLVVGDNVRIQNQVGPNPLKWDKTGKLIEVHQHDQYVIKVDGSGRVIIRNRKFLRKFSPFTPTKTGTHSPSQLPLRG